MNKARQAFYTKLIEDNSCNQRKLFRVSKRLFNQSQGDELPPNLHAPTFASEVGKYFVSKIDTIQRQIDADIIDLPASAFTTADGFNRSTPSLSAFKILSANSVKSLIHNSKLKSCPLDPMPSRSVSRCDALLPIITMIINKSLEAEHFPESWKEAVVCPLLKKPGLDIIFKNFRPVSNLAFLSKLIEKAVFHQIHDTNLYPNSTETALLKVKNDILLNMNKQHVTLLVLLDLSAAFDTVEHNILLEALNILGLRGQSVQVVPIVFIRAQSEDISSWVSVEKVLFELRSTPRLLFRTALVYHLYELVTRRRRKKIFHLSTAMQTIPNFTSLSNPETRQVTWMPLLLLIVVLRRSGVGCVRINYC